MDPRKKDKRSEKRGRGKHRKAKVDVRALLVNYFEILCFKVDGPKMVDFFHACTCTMHVEKYMSKYYGCTHTHIHTTHSHTHTHAPPHAPHTHTPHTHTHTHSHTHTHTHSRKRSMRSSLRTSRPRVAPSITTSWRDSTGSASPGHNTLTPSLLTRWG